MVTNRSRAYPIRSGKDVFEKDISVFGFEGITPLNSLFYSLCLRSIFFAKIFFEKSIFLYPFLYSYVIINLIST